jgi:hypothetical protein
MSIIPELRRLRQEDPKFEGEGVQATHSLRPPNPQANGL